MGPAETTCIQALELYKASNQEWYKISNLVGILLQRKKKKEAYKAAIAAVNQSSTNEMPLSLQRTIHSTFARAQWELGYSEPVLKSCTKAKASIPDRITPSKDLTGELAVVKRREEKTDYIQRLK